MGGDGEFAFDLAPFLPFRDRAACERARRIPRERLTEHPNPDFRIALVGEAGEFYGRFAEDLVGRIRSARDEGRRFVAIVPVGPMPQYEIAARMINEERLSLAHVHTFNMDEYADEDGVTAPLSWPGSFQRAMWEHFFALVEPDLRPPRLFGLPPELNQYRFSQSAPSFTSTKASRAGASSRNDSPHWKVSGTGVPVIVLFAIRLR